MRALAKTSMENNFNVEKLVSELAYLINDNEFGSEKPEENFFGKSDIAILTFIGSLLTIIIVMVALRFVIQPAYWYLVDLFSLVLLITLTYFFVIRKLFRKK